MARNEAAKAAIEIIDQLLEDLAAIVSTLEKDRDHQMARNRLQRWRGRTIAKLNTEFGSAEAQQFDDTTVIRSQSLDDMGDRMSEAEKYRTILTALREELEANPEFALSQLGHNTMAASQEHNPSATIEKICRRFHVVARQLRQRHSNRHTLDISDEYDVQDLLHALLKVDFVDVRPEEATPSYAGGSSRMDFLLKAEQIVIEVKKTRQGLDDREVGSQLIDDIARYQAHADCKKLFCFVYDPDGRIANPDGLEHDLSKRSNNMDVIVIVSPKGE